MHSLSEQVVTFAAIPSPTESDLSNRCIEVAQTIAAYTGWDRDGAIMYMDAGHKFHINFDQDTQYQSIIPNAYFNDSIGIANTTNSRRDIRQTFTVRMHRSTNEKTTYICIGDTSYNTFIYAENDKSEGVLFRYGLRSNAGYLYVGANALTTPFEIGIPATSGRRKYSVAKYVDDFSSIGGEFSELYWVYSTVSPPVHNTLVSFDGTVMRLVSPNLAAANMMFAFPVSDTDSNE